MSQGTESIMQWCAAIIFGVALIHTFSTKLFERLAHTQPHHSGVWHLLGEIEIVFGFWAMVLMVCLFWFSGSSQAISYLESRDFTEPMFVFAIMVIAGTRPVLEFVSAIIRFFAWLIPASRGVATYFVILALVPPMGSYITEPAAMTVAALMLRDTLFSQKISERLKYATLGVLFVNISIGGTMTHFAAPPVLMVAAKWNWDLAFMFSTFGWKSLLAVLLNAFVATLIFRKDLQRIDGPSFGGSRSSTPLIISAIHLLFLLGVVVFAHHPVIFMAFLLFFLGFATAYKAHQDPLILREALLVAFFLAGLVVLGGQQQWWLQPLLLSMDSTTVFYGATVLTAITDNAALTYLGSLVDGLSDEFKVALVAGAVAGGGLTVIANAPNPAGVTILKGKFQDETIHPLGLLLAALPPTLVAVIAFRWL